MSDPTRIAELLSALACVVSIWFNTQKKTIGWPIGLVSIVLAAWVYFKSHLFAECALQAFFFVSGLYGWNQWINGKQENGTVSVRRAPFSSIAAGIGLGLIFTFIGYYLLKQHSSASQPFTDSAIASYSMVAQVWLARRWLENWLLWMIINTGSIFLYISKDLWFFTALYGILLFLAVKGFNNWKAAYLNDRN